MKGTRYCTVPRDKKTFTRTVVRIDVFSFVMVVFYNYPSSSTQKVIFIRVENIWTISLNSYSYYENYNAVQYLQR